MTSQELYAAIAAKPDLHSVPELHGEYLFWQLYKDAYVQAFCINGKTSISIVGSSVFSGSLIHWQPGEDDMVDELYTLGKNGNVLVLKKSLLGTHIFYCGPAENFPHTGRPVLHFGKKKWDGGQLVYLEQK